MSATRKDSETIKGCVVMLVWLLLSPVTVLVRAFVVVKLWQWFVVPFGAPQIGKAWAYGLVGLVSLISGEGTAFSVAEIKEKMGIKPSPGKSFFVSLGMSGICLLCGYIAHRLMV